MAWSKSGKLSPIYQRPAGIDFLATIHAADERIPVDVASFGAEAMYQLLSRYSDIPLS